MVTGNIHNNSDVDIGINGMPEGNFFRIYSILMESLDVEFDLIDFDFNYQFFDLLNMLGEVIEIE